MDDLTIPTFASYAASQVPKTRAERIMEYVAANPGAKGPQIADALGLPRSNVSSQIAEMIRTGLMFRCGLRFDYVHFTDKAACDAAHAGIVAATKAERIATKRAAIKRRNSARAQIRAAKLAAGEDVRRKPSLKPREQRLEGRVEAYLRDHQGAKSGAIREATGIGKNSITWALNVLMNEGAIWRVGVCGHIGCTYYSDRALWEKANAEYEAGRSVKRKKASADTQARREAERQRIAAREALRQAREAERAAAKAERERIAAEAKARREREADARRLKREAEEAARKERAAQAAQRVKVKTESPAVRAPAMVWANAEPIIRDGVKVTIVPPPRGRYEADIKPGQGAISADYVARRQGQFVPSRLVGSYA